MPPKRSTKKPAPKRRAAAPKKKPAKKPARKTTPTKLKFLTPAKTALLATLKNVTRLQFTANSQALFLARANKKTLTLFDIASASETPPLKALPTFTSAALSTDSRHIAMGTSTGIIAVQSSQTGKILWKTKATGEPILDLAFTLDGSLIIATTHAWLRIHHAQTGEPITAFEPISGASCPHIAFSPEGLFMAHSEIRSNSILVWHLPTRQVAQFIKLAVPHGQIRGLAFGPTVRQLFIAQQRHITGWNGETGTQFIEFPTQGSESLAIIEQGNVLATTRAAAENQKAAMDIWSSGTGRLRRSVTLPDLELGPLAASPDGSLLALPTNRDCWLWNAAKLAAI